MEVLLVGVMIDDATSIAIDLKPIFSQGSSLIKDNDFNESWDVDSWRRDTEDTHVFKSH